MARFHYDLTQAEPIIRDVPIYAAARIAKGEMLMSGPIGGTLQSGFITVNATTSTGGDNALGVCLETITTTSPADRGDIISTAATTATPAISSIASTVATGSRYGKAIINPFAIYLAEYEQGATSAWTCAANAGTTTYTDTVAQYSEGSWMYVVPATSTAADGGQLGYITVSTSTTSWTLLAAMTTTTNDKAIHIFAINHNNMDVTGTAGLETKFDNLTANDIGTFTKYKVLENYVTGTNRPMEPLRAAIHSGIQDKTLKFFTDFIQIDHCYCGAVAQA